MKIGSEGRDLVKYPLFENGMTKGTSLSIKEAIAFPPNSTIILLFNKELQPFSICKKSWKTVNKATKEYAYNMVKKKCKQNVLNRLKQVYTHTESSKILARRKDEEEQLQRKRISRGELSTTVHKKRMARISMTMREHPELVRGLGVGPYPTQLFGSATSQ
ncbi:hypothetical protein Ahy_A05g022409 [Arachis hypogaea]|uniref:Uncharacterized protein n=1 Tax=Arachis hypogaea TaxID=3818 RepID=A0A445D0X5_ARAHY|nr:hypothetical protein Ahy_A05g022409 [Arachis hypogaea]